MSAQIIVLEIQAINLKLDFNQTYGKVGYNLEGVH